MIKPERMSEYKITCPHCSQHISLDGAWSGRALNCPACEKPFTVPQLAPAAPAPPPPAPAAGGLRMNTPAAPQPAPAARGPQPVSAAPRTCGLAIASLVLSLLGCAFVTAIAGVICGHLALKRIRNNAALSGRGLAMAGVIIGYVMIALCVASGIKFALDVKSKVEEVQEQMTHPTPPQPGATAPNTTSGGNAAPGARVKSSVPAPADAVSGTVKGEPFNYTRSNMALNTGSLEIDGREFAREGIVMEIFLGKKSGENLGNRTWHITPTTPPGTAPIIVIVKMHGGASTQDRFVSGYQMDLTTGPIAGGTVSGTMSLKVNGAAPLDIKGNFTARVN